MQHNTPDYDYLFKLLVVGDPASGKTWFIRKAVDELIPDTTIHQPLNIDFKIKTITDPETNKKIKLQLWRHQAVRHRQIAASPFRGANGILITVDVTSGDSSNNLKYYMEMVDRYASEGAKVLVIATKTDNSDRRVWNEEILNEIEQKVASNDYWKDKDVQFIETSALKNFNIDQALQIISRSILRRIIEASHPNSQPPKNYRGLATKEKPRCTIM